PVRAHAGDPGRAARRGPADLPAARHCERGGAVGGQGSGRELPLVARRPRPHGRRRARATDALPGWGGAALKVGLVLPGFSADADDWGIPALRHLVGRLASTDEVYVLALRYPYRAGHYTLFGARVTALGGGQRYHWGSFDVWRRAFAELAAEHRRARFDVLHAFWADETGALTAVAGKLLGVPTIVSLAGGELVGLGDIGYGGQLALTGRLKARLALHLPDRLTAGSRGLAELAARRLGPNRSARLCRAPLGVDLCLF